jgi:hypothetical protein
MNPVKPGNVGQWQGLLELSGPTVFAEWESIRTKTGKKIPKNRRLILAELKPHSHAESFTSYLPATSTRGSLARE